MSVDMRWLNERAGTTPSISEDERTIKPRPVHVCKRCGKAIPVEQAYCSAECRIEADKLTPMIQGKKVVERRQELRTLEELAWLMFYDQDGRDVPMWRLEELRREREAE